MFLNNVLASLSFSYHDSGNDSYSLLHFFYAFSVGNMKLSEVIKVAGYKPPEKKADTVYQHIYRTSLVIKKSVSGMILVPLIIVLGRGKLHNLSLSSSSFRTNLNISNDVVSLINIVQVFISREK